MANELELRVDSAKYEEKISLLEGYVHHLETLMSGYQDLQNRVSDFMGDDENIELARRSAQVGIDRCKKAIQATKENINTIQEMLDKVSSMGENIKTVLETALEVATAGLFD